MNKKVWPSKAIKWLQLCCMLWGLLALSSCYRPPEKAEIVNFDKTVEEKIPNSLRRAFVEHWAARARLDWNEIYRLEAPHVKWAYSQNSFVGFRAKAAKPISVKVTSVEEVAKGSVKIGCEVKFQSLHAGKEEVFYPREIWVQVKGNWYHVWRIPFFEKFV